MMNSVFESMLCIKVIFLLCSMSIFNEEVDEFDGLHAIVETLYFIDDLCSMGSRLEHNNVLFMHCSLMYYEMVNIAMIIICCMYHVYSVALTS